MKHWNKFMRIMGLATSFCCIVSLFNGAAFGAIAAPVVTVLPVIKEGTVTPTRLAQDSFGNIWVADPHAEGVLEYDAVGNLMKKIITEKEPGGIAFAKNGDLLVTLGTYVAAINPGTGVVKTRFGSFKSAFAIAVDDTPTTGTGNIFVSDIQNYCVQAFNSSYADLDVSAGTGHNIYRATDSVYRANFIGDSQIGYFAGPGFFNRPAGVAIEHVTGYLAVVDSLNGSIQFFDQAGNTISNWLDANSQPSNAIGAFGYDPTHAVVMLTYPQSISFEYNAGALTRAYILDAFQSSVMVLDASATLPAWPWSAEIGLYGHLNGNLIVPSDVLVDKKDPANNRLLVSNGFGSVSVFGLSSLQPYNVVIDSITDTSMRISWSSPAPASIKQFNVYRSTVAGKLSDNTGAPVPVKMITTTSFVDTPLQPYTTYYYTVRAVDLGNIETTNVSQVSAKTTGMFNLSVNISGNGSINGSVSCTTGTCGTTSQKSDALITLIATATGQSVFNGWTGDCFTTSDTCLITMDAAKSVTAFFAARPAFRVDGAYFDNLQDAYREAKDGSVIKVLAGTWPSTTSSTEYMTAWQAKTVRIEGGYDATFTNNAGGSSTVLGRTNLNAGKVVMKQFKLK